MRVATGGLLLAALLAACATSPGVVATGARPAQAPSTTTHPVEASPPTTAPSTNSTAPVQADTTPASTTTVVGPLGRNDNGIGDVLFPSLGNPGIDVEHYVVKLDYDRQRNHIAASVHLDVVMTEDRDKFSLDSAGPVVSAVSVDGAPAEYIAAPPELLITPATHLVLGQHIGVDVTYTLTPAPVPSLNNQLTGWFPTSGGSYVYDEPEGTKTWLPSDDHPSDKATFRFELTVPSGVTAVANGALVDHTSAAGSDTWIWQEDRPMATYLIQLLTGDYEIVDGTGPNGLPLVSVVLRQDRTTMQPYVDSIDDQVAFFDGIFGPYPLDRYGIAITDFTPGIAMETMERPMFSRQDFSTGQLDLRQEFFLSHELAHQWFGDAVTPSQWTDIWLNESFATYAEWLWLDHLGVMPLEQTAESALAKRLPQSTATPTGAEMFGFNSYDGGAVILHALRKTIGDDRFFALLRRWVSENNGSSRTTGDFVALANQVAGQDLTRFFATWLYAATVPTSFPG